MSCFESKMKIISYIAICFTKSGLVSTLDPITHDLLTPMREFGEACGYESCPRVKEGTLNVHIVPHTHGELGYTRTFYQHFTGYDDFYDKSDINMKRIFDYTISELWAKEDRKFTLSDIAYFFHWWSKRDGTGYPSMVYQLIRQGRLFLLGGGWSMSDEATTSYHAIIDHYTYALRKINATFLECGRPLVSWQSDVFGHSKEFASLMALMGFDGHFINPISFDDELARMERNAMEFLWRGSDDLGTASDIYTHKLFDGYWSPPGFCFGGQCSDPLFVTSDTMFRNVEERVKVFIEAALHRQGPYYTTRNIMVVMGQLLGYYDAGVWFENIDKLIDSVTNKSVASGNPVNVFYSSPACYLQAVHSANPELQTKQDDFLPYVYDKNTYAVGMYSSRPTLKYMARDGHLYLQICKQLQVLARLGNNDKMFENLNWVTGIFQDHNVITGSLRQYVKDYYTEKMYIGVQISTKLITTALNKLRKSPESTKYFRCAFNESRCTNSNQPYYFVVVYNPLAWNVTVPVRLPMIQMNYVVFHPSGLRYKASIMKLPTPVLKLPMRYTNADHELVFIAEDIPPLGFRSYYIRQRDLGWRRDKRSIKKKINKDKKKKYLVTQDNFSVLNKDENIINEFSDEDYEEETTTVGNEPKIILEDISKNEKSEFNKSVTPKNGNTERTYENSTEIDQKDFGVEISSEAYKNGFIIKTSTEIHKEILTEPKTEFNNDTTEPVTTTLGVETTTSKIVETTKVKDVEPSKFEQKEEQTTTDNISNIKPERWMKENITIEETPDENEKMRSPDDEFWESYDYLLTKDNYIRNRYIKITTNKNSKISHVELSNGVNISLDIQFYFYASDDPAKFDRNDKNPGPYIFRAMDPNPMPIMDNVRTKIYKSKMVQEIHTEYSNYASFVVRLYRRSPVIELQWLVGPIPIEDEIGKDVFIRYSTNLVNKGVFYTDSNGRQTVKRIRDKRASYEPVLLDPIAGNYYPVTSKIHIEDIEKNLRFSIFNDRSQGGTSLNDGEIDLMLHRRILTDDIGIQAILNETEKGQGISVRGTHYLYLTKADYKPNRIFEKKFAKELELKSQIFVTSKGPYAQNSKKIWLSQRNEFTALKSSLPLGVHVLTLEKWNGDTILLRLENYLEKSDTVRSGIKRVFLKNLFVNLKVLSVRETTLGANMWLKEWYPLRWNKKERFLKNFNEAYGTGDVKLDKNDYIKPVEEVDLDKGIVLAPQEIRTFVVTFEYVGDI